MRRGYFINESLHKFDNAFFNINNLEAGHMDPQQRMLLEVVYECLESGGVRLCDIAGAQANVGCFVGNFTVDFQTMQARDSEYQHRYTATGVGTTILSNRISHAFDLRGPSVTLDTACSSSLYCLHFACRALAQGDCKSAIVAAANLIQSVEQFMGTSAAGVLSNTSTCHTFSANADGYGRAEAVGALYLKRLSDAIRDNDPIRAVIRGTAVNANGRTPGITLPSSSGQEAVIAHAYKSASLKVHNTAYVECHGTGTPVGDPIEINALANFYQNFTGANFERRRLLVGSVKSNFGHSEAASGILSILKTTLALEHLEIPATIGIEQLNPKIPWEDINIDVVRSHLPWPASNLQTPRASIGSFGYGGANAHCILERAPSWKERNGFLKSNSSIHRKLLLPLSAKSRNALEGRVTDLGMLDLACVDVSDLAYTLAERRTVFDWRGFLIVEKPSNVRDISIDQFSHSIQQRHETNPPLAFLFTGQGAQWTGMGKELLQRSAVFRDSILRSQTELSLLSQPPPWSLVEVILAPPEESTINDPWVSQTLCTALQMALIDLLYAWNIVPSHVIGHSSGEIAAAYAAGHLTSFIAISTAYTRGRTVSTMGHEEGAMIAVGISSEVARAMIHAQNLSQQASVACINSPDNVTLSGDANAIQIISISLQREGKFVRKLKTGGKAYHSNHMKVLGAAYESQIVSAQQLDLKRAQRYACNDIKALRNTVSMVSTVYEREITAEVTGQAAYWRANLESPVMFSSTIRHLLEDSDYQFVEIGPHPVLKLAVNQTISIVKNRGSTPYLSSLERNKDSEQCILSLAGSLWSLGYSIDLVKVNDIVIQDASEKPHVLCNLPNYRWNHSELLWKEPRASYEFRQRRFPRDDLLGSSVPGSSGLTHTWRNMLSTNELPWLQDHRLGKDAVFPATGYIAMASRAVQQTASLDTSGYVLEIRDMHLMEAMILPSKSQLELFTELVSKKISDLNESSSWWHFTISTFSAGQCTKHASGDIGFTRSEEVTVPGNSTMLSNGEPQHSRVWYSRFSKVGMDFGPNFRSLSEIFLPRMRDSMAVKASLNTISPGTEDEHCSLYSFEVHPIALDAQLQTGLIGTSRGNLEDLKGQVPNFIERVQIFRSTRSTVLAACTIYSSSRTTGFGMTRLNSHMLDGDGRMIARLCNVKAVSFHSTLNEQPSRHPMLRVQWQPDISKLNSENVFAFGNLLTERMQESKHDNFSKQLHGLEILLQLITHHRSELTILELGTFCKATTTRLMTLLGKGNCFQRFKSFCWGSFDAMGRVGWCEWSERPLPEQAPSLEYHDLINGPERRFDVILFPDGAVAQAASVASSISTLLAAGGMAAIAGNADLKTLAQAGLRPLSIPIDDIPTITLMKHSVPSAVGSVEVSPRVPPLLLIVADLFHPLNIRLSQALHAQLVQVKDLDAVSIPERSRVIVTAELDKPLLSIASSQQLAFVQKITDSCSNLLWVTGGNLIAPKTPDISLVFGLARTIMAEQPSLKFSVVDIDDPRTDVDLTVSNLVSILEAPFEQLVDYEYIQRDSIIHVSRFIADDNANRQFAKKKAAAAENVLLRDVGSSQLSIKAPGQLDTLHFVQTCRKLSLPDDHVEIQVMATSINAKVGFLNTKVSKRSFEANVEQDLYTLSGKIETVANTCSCEFSGIVAKVGRNVSDFSIGDRVVACAPGHFSTYECVPSWACCKMLETENFSQVACAPTVFATVVYALRDLGSLRADKTVLIHSAAGGVGIAAIQLAKETGAQIYATVGTEEKKAYLVKEFGLDPARIFNSRDTSFAHQILKATDQQGVDVILNSLTGERLHASLDICAKFGRFIEIGKRDIVDAGKLNMRAFERGISLSAFDLHELYYSPLESHRRKYSKLLRDALACYRRVGLPNPEVFSVGEIRAAFRHFANGTRIGKIVVSFEEGESMISHVSKKFTAQFSSEKSYLLVGCLGGLGRTIARYMLLQGARHFSFIGRTGTDKAAAKSLVQELKRRDATVDIVRGDVQDYDVVRLAVDRLQLPLGGVVQAAMALEESLFTKMTHTQWSSVIGPKVSGSWNIHKAIEGKDNRLDFFLMTSSISGSVCSPTESNYCAANCFLDSFAAYRRSLGLPATAVALGQISGIGYIYEHQDIEQMLARRGVAELTEDDMLLIIDIALSGYRKGSTEFQPVSHILTGLEPAMINDISNKGYTASLEMFKTDPRLHILALAAPTFREAQGGSTGHGLPPAVVSALASKNAQAVQKAVFEVLSERLSHLILVPQENITLQLRLTEIGMDSMLAAEYRTFLFRSLSVDVPFLTLMDSKSRMSDITSLVSSLLHKQASSRKSMCGSF